MGNGAGLVQGGLFIPSFHEALAACRMSGWGNTLRENLQPNRHPCAAGPYLGNCERPMTGCGRMIDPAGREREEVVGCGRLHVDPKRLRML